MNQEIYENVLQLIGNTPIVHLKNFSTSSFHVFAKCEFFNPGGSIKDRIGYTMLNEAEKRNWIKPGGTIIEATAGNTGIALAMAAAQRGYRLVLVVTDRVSEDKIRLLKACKAEIVRVPYSSSTENPGAFVKYAEELSRKIPNSWFVNQFESEINYAVHYETTGPEIWRQMAHQVDVFIAGIGTGGTLCGVGHYLKEVNPHIKIILADPVGSVYHSLFHQYSSLQAKKFLIEGIGGDFLPKIANLKIIDEVISVSDVDACKTCYALFDQAGLFVGPSSGAIVCAAIRYGKALNVMAKRPYRIVVILPDSGRNYLNTFYDEQWCEKNLGLNWSRGRCSDKHDFNKYYSSALQV